MSQPKYMKHDASPTSIIVDVEELVSYLFTITNNEKQFGKAYRYTLVAEIRNTCLKLYKQVFKGLSIKPKYLEQYDQRATTQQKAYNTIVELRALLIVAAKVANIQNLEHLSILLDKVIKAHEEWVKSDRKLYGRLPTFDEYMLRKRNKEERRKKRAADIRARERDADGFIIMLHKDPMAKKDDEESDKDGE